MKIHEYQAKEILRRYGVATPRGKVIDDPGEARAICEEMGGKCVVKAQIHAGGRGKGGGVKVAKSPQEAADAASRILGMQLVTHQTGPEGQKVRKVLIEEAADIAQEFYVAVTHDRESGRPVVISSPFGGMDIEAVAEKDPQAIHREDVDPQIGLVPFQARRVARGLGLRGDVAARAAKLVQALVAAYLDTDASLAEVNPLMVTGQGEVMALDAKMNFDDNALFRHPEVVAMRDLDEEDPAEVEASKFDLNYIQLDGNIGCLVNGAGLAMATMDIIKHHGGAPANFLDVGGGATKDQVTKAFKMILSSPKVKGIFVNIFGGIMRCDVIAEGVVAATRELGLKVPLVVRLEGTNVEQGKAILASSGLQIQAADGMADGAKKIVAAVRAA